MKTRIIPVIITILFISQLSYSQNNDTTAVEGDNDAYSSLMINASYTNNNLEYLTGTTEKIPTVFTNITFFHKSGFYTGLGYSYYFTDSTKSYEYDLEAGYQKYFDNGFDIDIGYNWHKYEGDSLLEGLNYDHSVMLMLGQDIEKSYLTSSLSYTIGNSNNIFFDISLSRFIQVDNLFSKNDVLLINPTFSLSFSTDNWLYENLTEIEKEETFAYLDSYGYTYETFSYESFDFYLPLSYGIKNTYVTISWLYKIPGQKYKSLGWENKSGFMFSLTYFLNFSK